MAQDMSLNAVLMKFIKLPPAVKIVLALVGFGSLASLATFLTGGSLRTRQGQITLLIIGVIGLLIFGLIYLIRRYIWGRRAGSLTGALESQGPTRGDIAEQEQIYREKFRAKLNDLKANGLSVYKLPWFILMGEPGCGKTASLIHSGLDFPLGKDEVPGFGGTRNYNWWFTNEAVILDTAGRIAFHEEGTTDKVEWEYFIKLLKKFRPRCPLNGVVIALPADKLLRDSSDERATKAAVLRERLRQIHQLLGVRFPTFVLVTKMDLVGGFNEFFEEIRADLQLRNQIFGWSRPGEFQTPYDPNTFEKVFDDTYSRIRDWCMKYLRRNVPESELGMIVTFPESFRQLRAPLNEFIGTIFQKSPLLEPPFFRGYYFASSVQEGAPILDIFARTRHGLSISERAPRAVDSKAFFIHDLYARKIFPEHGLVFRSAKHVSLDRRMRRLVWWGGGAMFAAMMGLFSWGCLNVQKYIEQPRKDCQAAATHFATETTPAPAFDIAVLRQNIELAQRLHNHIQIYDDPVAGWAARALFIGANIKTPQAYVRDIHARLVMDGILKPVLDETHARLANALAPDRDTYLKALVSYTRWFGEMFGEKDKPTLQAAEAPERASQFANMLALCGIGDPDAKTATDQVRLALESLSTSSSRRTFASELLLKRRALDSAAASQRIVDAIAAVQRSLRNSATLSVDNNDPLVKYWAIFGDKVARVRERYDTMLAARDRLTSGEKKATDEAVEDLRKILYGADYLNDYDKAPETSDNDSLKRALYDFHMFLKEQQPPDTVDHRIVRLGMLLDLLKKRWEQDFKPIEDALAIGAGDKARPPAKAVFDALTGARESLESSFKKNLEDLRTRLNVATDKDLLDDLASQQIVEVDEAKEGGGAFDRKPSVKLSGHALGQDNLLQTYLMELNARVRSGDGAFDLLSDLTRWPGLLEGSAQTLPSGELGNWFSRVSAAKEGAARDVIIIENSKLKTLPFWRPPGLYSLADALWNAQGQQSRATLLAAMEQRARDTMQSGDLSGIARLMPGYDQPSKNLPFNRNRFNGGVSAPQPTTPVVETPASEPAKEEAPPNETPLERARRLAAGGAAKPAAPTTAPTPAEPKPLLRGDELLSNYHTRDFLGRTLRAYQQISDALKKLDNVQNAGSLKTALDGATGLYIERYLGDWERVYRDPTRFNEERFLSFIEKLVNGITWPDFVAALDKDGVAYGNGLAVRIKSLATEYALCALDKDLLGNPVGSQLLDSYVLKKLPKDPDNLIEFADIANDPGAPASKVASAWSGYVSELKQLGPLDGVAKSSGKPPSVADLQKNALSERGISNANSRFVAPMLDIAEYGDELLRYHLRSRLSDLARSGAGRYPFAGSASAIDEKSFSELIRAAETYRSSFKSLIGPDEEAFLNRLASWGSFLATGDDVRVKVGILGLPGDSGVNNLGFVHSEVDVQLPFIDQSTGMPLTLKGNMDNFGLRSTTPYTKDCVVRRGQGPLPVSFIVKSLTERAKGRYKQEVPLAPFSSMNGWDVLAMSSGSVDKGNRQSWRLLWKAVAGDDESGQPQTIGVAIELTFAAPLPDVIGQPPVPGAPPSADKLKRWLKSP